MAVYISGHQQVFAHSGPKNGAVVPDAANNLVACGRPCSLSERLSKIPEFRHSQPAQSDRGAAGMKESIQSFRAGAGLQSAGLRANFSSAYASVCAPGSGAY